MTKALFKVTLVIIPILLIVGFIRYLVQGTDVQFIPDYDVLEANFSGISVYQDRFYELVGQLAAAQSNLIGTMGNITDIGSFFEAFGSFFATIGSYFVIGAQIISLPFQIIWFLIQLPFVS